MGCDFPGRDLARVSVAGEKCAAVCSQLVACTHFVWNELDGGVCYAKTGQVSRTSAVASSAPGVVCGYLGNMITSYL
jgi:hypothetical protein